MQPILATSASSHGAQARENEILAEHESLLAGPPPSATPATRRRSWPSVVFWRVVPLMLLAAVGAALALMPADIKDALTTGRSVAHGANP